MKKGFTLAEFVLAIMIIGIILLTISPTISRNIVKSNKILIKAVNKKLLPNVIAEILHDNPNLDNTFCNKFLDKVNTIGGVDCNSSTIPDIPNFITSNRMRWYGFNPGNFSSGNRMLLKVDVNGQKKPNIEGKDIIDIYVCTNGTISQDSSLVCP